MNNIEKTGYRNIFSGDTLPFEESRPFYFPTFTRINNIEKTI